LYNTRLIKITLTYRNKLKKC